MPKIPQYQVSGARLTTSAPSPEMAASAGEMMAKAGEGLAGLAEHWQKLRDRDETIKAQYQLNSDLDRIHIEAANDPDYWGSYGKAQKKMTDAIQSASKGISSYEAKEIFMDKANIASERKLSVLNMSLMKKQLEASKVNSFGLIEQLKNQYYQDTPKEHSITESKIKEVYDEAVASGYMHPTEAYNRYEKDMHEIRTGIVKSDIQNTLATINPSEKMTALRDEFMKGKDGIYSMVPESERGNLLEDINQGVKKAAVIESERGKITQQKTEKSLAMKYWNGAATVEEVQQQFAAGHIRKGTYNQLMRGITTGTVVSQPHPKEFADMMDFIGNESHSEQDIMDELLKKQADGKLTMAETRAVAGIALIPGDKDPLSAVSAIPGLDEALIAQEQKAEQSNQQKGWASSAWHMIRSICGKDDKKAVELMKRTISKGGEVQSLPNTAKKVVSENIRQEHPETNFLEDHPNMVSSFSEGAKTIWEAPSNAKAGYQIIDGQIVPVSNKKESNYKVGDRVAGSGGKQYEVKGFYPDGEPDVVEVKE